MAKTIMVLLDGCTYQEASENMGYLEHLCEVKWGAKYKIKSELPAMSRPLYETLMTGLAVSKHRIFNNLICRESAYENIFSMCKEAGLVTGAAAYFWISELYNKAPFDYVEDRIQLERNEGITHGIYYYEDSYPDSHVFSDGEFIRRTYHPDFLLIHSMNIDYEGHLNGSGSKAYSQAVIKADVLLSSFVSLWMSEGYDILITADHGMTKEGFHCGNTELNRTVPLYILSQRIKGGVFTDKEISQLAIAPLLCYLLGIKPAAESMDLMEAGVAFKC
jgi:predicted AlkP superfamily pyrophosphatase or phosphodiesterase